MMDKRIIEHMRFSSIEDQKEMMKMFETFKHKPEIKLMMAILKDSMVYKDMANSMLISLKYELKELRDKQYKAGELSFEAYMAEKDIVNSMLISLKYELKELRDELKSLKEKTKK